MISHQIYKKLLSQGGSMSLTTEEFRHLGWVLSENLARRAYVMAEVGINKVTWRIKELRAMGRLQGEATWTADNAGPGASARLHKGLT